MGWWCKGTLFSNNVKAKQTKKASFSVIFWGKFCLTPHFTKFGDAVVGK